MRRWDRLLDSYIEEYRARGVRPQSVAYTEARLNRWGRWLKGRRPRIGIEHIEAEMITRYVANCSSFRAKATVYATLSTMRGFGDYLVRQGLWKINPLRWMKGPKVTPYSRLPKRIDHAHMSQPFAWGFGLRSRHGFRYILPRHDGGSVKALPARWEVLDPLHAAKHAAAGLAAQRLRAVGPEVPVRPTHLPPLNRKRQ